MPYITKKQRAIIDERIQDILAYLDNAREYSSASCDGEINYIITRILSTYYNNKGYSGYNRAIGVLECAKLEFYRRLVAVYEDKKKESEGDVY